MRVFRFSPALTALLMENPGETATLSVGDKIKIETDFETRAYLSLALEQCWLSDGSDLRQGGPSQSRTSSNDPRWLVWQGCPSNANISMSSSTSSNGHYPSFSFQVTEDHYKMKRVYIVCLIGLCTPDDSLPAGNIGKVKLNFCLNLNYALFYI